MFLMFLMFLNVFLKCFYFLLSLRVLFRPGSKCKKGTHSNLAFAGTLAGGVCCTFDCEDFSALPFLAMF